MELSIRTSACSEVNNIVCTFAGARIKKRSEKRINSLNVDDTLIDSKTFLILRRKLFFLAKFSFLLLSLLLSPNIHAADSLEDLKNSAEQGDAEAQFKLGLMYYRGDGVQQNYVVAADWFLKVAEQGYALAQYNLGVMYDNGRGVPENDRTAVQWYLKAAEQGYASAQYNLGVMYDNGRGVPENDRTAVQWYLKAAEQGYASAQYNLGVMYDNGWGVPENDRTAVQWYLKAAEQGNASAQYNLGLMFYRGEGVPKDNVQAYAWISIAVAQGNNDSWKNAKETVADSMTRDEVTRAQKLSDDLWKAFGPGRSTK